MRQRRVLGISFGAGSLALLVAAPALACTVVFGGQTTVTEVTDGNGNTLMTCGTTVSDCVVDPGDWIKVKATNLKADQTNQGGEDFNVHFLNQSKLRDIGQHACMGAANNLDGISGSTDSVPTALKDTKLDGGPYTTDSNGDIGPETEQIPTDAVATTAWTGKAWVCFIEADSSGDPDYSGEASGAYALSVRF